MRRARRRLGGWRPRCRRRSRLPRGRAGAAGREQDRRPGGAGRYHPPADHGSQGTTLVTAWPLSVHPAAAGGDAVTAAAPSQPHIMQNRAVINRAATSLAAHR